ncbi:exodeoxyribonuclease VII small subunit [Reichenbachiella agarivorans]|uniref:Exodeoxyribonuclease VII small subunit n=1 Tax=Reichenbachiella agarivorans TaxID=2979464 RepID=A0ABY6CTZ9_9BACT|nr:exodeoxyribonuclease VII small subunit [Reichenbachiella agarivorans]UXP31725.1 exodeoxyribonuclease VII small subunit [Reichenbachiella agarivorans]
MNKKKPSSYQAAFEELQSIATQLESGEANIDELSALVKRAKELVLYCQERLKGTEKELSES